MKLKKDNKTYGTIRYLRQFSNKLPKYYIKFLITLLIVVGVFVPIVIFLSRLNLPSPIFAGIGVFLFLILWDIGGRVTGVSFVEWNPYLLLSKRPSVMVWTVTKGSFKSFGRTLLTSLIIALITFAIVTILKI